MELHDVVEKLTGEIMPVGETYADNKRYDNLKSMCVLVDKLIYNLDAVVRHNKDAPEFSRKRAADHVIAFFDDLGIEG